MADIDIVSKCFQWKSVTAVQDNLTKWYPQLNVRVDDLNDYIQCGCSHADLPNSQDNYFKLMFGGKPQPPVRLKCICGTRIKEQYYVCPKSAPYYENIIVVGNECIDKFSDESIRGRRCEVCFAKHRNKSFNLCNEHIQPKKRVSRAFGKILSHEGFNNTFIQKIIKKKRQKRSDDMKNVLTYLRLGFSGFKNHVHVIKNMQHIMMRHYLQNKPRVYASKHTMYKSLWRTQALQKLFKQFKVQWALKYCTFKEQVSALTPRLRSYVLNVVDNRKHVMPCGKYKHETFNYFYNNSTPYHKQYFMNIPDPDIHLKPVQEYIYNMFQLSKAGYCINIPDIIVRSMAFVVDFPHTPEAPKDTQDIHKNVPELKLIDDSELARIRLEDKLKYEQSVKQKF